MECIKKVLYLPKFKSTHMSTKTKKTKVNTPEGSVQEGIKIIDTAIKKKTSLGKAAKFHKRGRNYVPQITLTIDENLDKENITKKLFNEYNRKLNEFNKLTKRLKKEASKKSK